MVISFKDVSLKRDRTLSDRLKQIQIGNCTYVFGNVRQPYEITHFNLDIAEGEVLALVDSWQPWHPSAILRAAVGLEEMTSGNIEIGQSPAYLEDGGFRTTWQNLRYDIDSRKGFKDVSHFMASRAQVDKGTIDKYSEMAGLRTAGRRVRDLTYTEQMMMELVCAVAKRPHVMLVDQLTQNTERRQMRSALQRLQKETGGTWIYATGCMGETIGLVNKVAYMSNGSIAWILPAEELFENPPNAHAAMQLGYTVLKGIIYKNNYPGAGGTKVWWNDCAFMCVEQGSMRLPYLKERPDQLKELKDKEVFVAIHPDAINSGRLFHRQIDNWYYLFVPSLRTNQLWNPFDIPIGDYLFPDPSKLHFYDGKTGLPIDIGYIGPKLDAQKVKAKLSA